MNKLRKTSTVVKYTFYILPHKLACMTSQDFYSGKGSRCKERVAKAHANLDPTSHSYTFDNSTFTLTYHNQMFMDFKG